MGYPSHIGRKTTDAIRRVLGQEPKVGVEVGSFIGSSAKILGSMMKENGGLLLCIDT